MRLMLPSLRRAAQLALLLLPATGCLNLPTDATATTEPPVDAVRIQTAPPVFHGDTVSLHADAVDRDGHAVSYAAVRWTSADTTVATISTDGVLTTRAPGAVRITARAGNASDAQTLIVWAADGSDFALR